MVSDGYAWLEDMHLFSTSAIFENIFFSYELEENRKKKKITVHHHLPKQNSHFQMRKLFVSFAFLLQDKVISA